MSSLGRLTAALGVAHNENTLALANINFDFSLFRVDAPLEFQALGANLSTTRRQEAEAGTPHRTARKLGALFEGVLPHVPELARAYGQRVSEIALSQRYNPRGNGEAGPFAAQMGADGTAIWAAATSGPGAFPVLMVACMLARLWTAMEATSVWVEIVACRKLEIQKTHTGDEANDYVLLQAAQQELLRPHLADWDASARAWLRTADEAKKLQQTQLMLIINNVHLPVSNNMNVYQSVIESSKTALSSMESIVKGTSQRVQSGAFLLGLSAWHLYPDMAVHGSVNRKVQQNDELVPPGTMITLGLQSSAETDDGIYWSLPLAHLRYYGDPVQSSRSTAHDGSRVSQQQFLYVILGAVLSSWESSLYTGLAIEWFAELCSWVNSTVKQQDDNEKARDSRSALRRVFQEPGWPNMLMVTATTYKNLASGEKELSAKLISLGYRRFANLLSDAGEERLPRYFGLLSSRTMFPLLKANSEEAIRELRYVASCRDHDGEELIIRYKHFSPTELAREAEKIGKRVIALYEYASAFPSVRSSTKRTHDGKESQVHLHKRWIAMEWNDNLDLELFALYQSHKRWCCRCSDNCEASCICKTLSNGCIHECSCSGAQRPCSVASNRPCTAQTKLAERASEIQDLGEDCVEEHPRSFIEHYQRRNPHKVITENKYRELSRSYKNAWVQKYDWTRKMYLRDAPWRSYEEPETNSYALEYVSGDMDSAALFRIKRPQAHRICADEEDDHISLDTFRRFFKYDAIDVSRLVEYLTRLRHGRYKPYIGSLTALASAMDVYNLLPETTVTLDIISKPLHKSLWASHVLKAMETNEASYNRLTSVERWDLGKEGRLESKWICKLDLKSTFACIAMFESGTCDVDPPALEHVFAMSSANSIFVAAPLLSDPNEVASSHQVRRVVGNIGRAGLAMLMPPQAPRIRKPLLDSWAQISHASFDGQYVDSFQSTSLHLSFTDYMIPLHVGSYGARDAEAFLIESLISVHDRDKWVADIDVLNTFKSPNLRRHPSSKACKGTTGYRPPMKFLTVDNWEELIDRERVSMVVRAHRNPTARLAAAAVSVAQGHFTVIMPEEFCCPCTLATRGDCTYIL